jgi:dGTPase
VDGYRAGDTARYLEEPPKRAARTAFERDRARVLHSSALRRLAAKTQVVAPWEDDFPRTRLTHTLEVAQIARELGAALGCDPDLVETAALAHDLGHPPFGHNGEDALHEAARACGGFEGNAQSLRVLTRLEAKSYAGDRSLGLNLTRASLDAATKYPWPRREGQRKFGVYDDDREVFDWARLGAPGERRCLEAQVMDWADDVAYSVHDVEDGLHAGLVNLGVLADPVERKSVADLAVDRYIRDAEPAEVAAALAGLIGQTWWPGGYDGSQRGLASLKNLTSQLIGRFCQAAERATREAYGGGRLTRYAADLEVPRSARLEVAGLKAVAAVYVMGRAGAEAVYASQRELLLELVSALRLGSPTALDPWLRPSFTSAADDAARLRVVIDQVASLTDPTAVAWHARLIGGRV